MIATTGAIIFDQLKAMDKMALWAWGAKEFMALPETDEHLGGLVFKVSTPKYKRGAMVKITLNGSDLYDVEVIRLTKNGVKQLGSENDVFCDMLVDVIDSLIEE